MSTIISIIIIGVSLSMDTFSLCLSLGAFNINNNRFILFIMLVGLFHFIMPILGSILGINIIRYLNINPNRLLGLIFIFLSIKMLLDILKKENNSFNLSILETILLAISVSLDSFTTGLGLNAITNKFVIAGLIFSICSILFSVLGYIIGKYSEEKLGIYANILGIIILLSLGIIHLFK